jgi:hypothetical protein
VISSRLYVPASWAGDLPRRRAAGVPDDLEFKTKPQLAAELIAEIAAEEFCPPWVTGDEVYGRDARLRARYRGPPHRLCAEDPLLVPRHAAHRPEDPRRSRRGADPGPRLADRLSRSGIQG